MAILLTIVAEIFVFFIRTDLKIYSDWLGEMALPAYLAGRDWSSALASCSYYGWGLTWIYTPIFLFSAEPVVIWFGYKIVNIFIISIISAIIYIIQVRWMKQKENIVTIIIAVSIALLTWIDFGKETTLFLGVWISALLFLETFYGNNAGRQKWTKLLLSIAVPAVTCYIKNIHESAICLSIVLFLLMGWDYFVAKKKSVYICAFVVSWGITYFLSNLIKAQVLELYTVGVSREIIYNTSAFQGTTLWFLNTWESVKTLFILIWSNFYTLAMWTYGMAVFAVFLVMAIIANAVRKRKLTQVISNAPQNGLLFYSLMATLIVVFGVAVNWGSGLYHGIRIGGKAFNYVRYYYPFFLPALLVCFVYLRQNVERLKKIKVITFYLVDFFATCYLAYLYPIMVGWSDSGGHIEWKYTYGFCFDRSVPIVQNIIYWIIFVIVFLAVLFWVKSENKYFFLMMLLCVFSISDRRVELDSDGIMENKFAFPSFTISACDASEKAIQLLLECGIDKKDVFLADHGSYYIYSLQFLLNDIPLQCITTEEGLKVIDDNSIIFSCQDGLCEHIGQEYERIYLDTDEYLYVKDIETIRKYLKILNTRL